MDWSGYPERDHLWDTLQNAKKYWSGRVDIQLEHLGYVAVKSGPGYSRASYILVNGN